MKQQYIILFGGTFDPVHMGHVLLAHQLHNTFKQPITILPTGIPPYKPQPKTTAQSRLDMIKLAFGDDSRFLIDTREISRNEYCYTYKTMKLLRNEVGYNIPIFFLIGSDSLISLDRWDNWTELFNLTNFIVAKRLDYDDKNITNNDLLNEIKIRKVKVRINEHTIIQITKNIKPAGNVYTLDFNPIAVSSTKIRQLIAQNESIVNLVPETIEQYIIHRHLYTL